MVQLYPSPSPRATIFSGVLVWAQIPKLKCGLYGYSQMGTLRCALQHGEEIVVTGYLKVTIHWALGKSFLVVPSLCHWLDQIASMKTCFHSISFCHMVVPSLCHWLDQIASLKTRFHSISFCHIFRKQSSPADWFSNCGIFALFKQIHFV